MGNTGLLKVFILVFSLLILFGCESSTDSTDPDNPGTDTPAIGSPGDESPGSGSPGSGTPDPAPGNSTNQIPVAVISPATEQSVTVGEILFINGSASYDPDGDTSLNYLWSFSGATSSYQSFNPATPGPVTFSEAGTVTISLVVVDSSGANSNPATLVVNVFPENTANLPPAGTITHDNGNGSTGSTGNLTIATGTSVEFSGAANDPENDPVSYSWGIPANVTSSGSTTSQTLTASFPVAGTYIISLTASDSNGNLDPTPAQVIVTVTDTSTPVNLPPNGSISHDNGTGATGSTGNIEITVGNSVVFQGSATDPENDPVTYAWVFQGGAASSTTTSGPVNVTYATPGSYLVSLTVTDNNGNVDATPATLTVNVRLPEFQHLPVLSDQDGNPFNNSATYNLDVNGNVPVNVVTLTGSWVTPMMRYNSLQLPPVIVARRGMQMTFNVDNNLNEETTIHWHGFKIPAEQDGGPDAPIAPGASRTYSFTLVQPGGPLWFHPHAHGTTATQVYNGLAGAFIVKDDITDNLENSNQIPSGEQDIALLLQDRRFGADNGAGQRSLVYSAGGMMGGMLGMLGDRILVNGVEMPGLDVSTRQYRFRIYNGSNARTYDVALSDNSNFTVAGTDGGLLNSPVVTDHIMLSAGERAEIIVDFSNYNVNDNVRLVSRSFPGGGMMGGGTLANGAAFDIMQFQITEQEIDDVTLYTSLPANADINDRLTAADATATRSFVMSVSMMPMQFLINGQTFDMNRIDEVVASGATEIWTISNTSTMAHPFHAHAIQWQVLDRNGVPASGVDLGWKDTVLVGTNETVRIIGRFDPVVNVGTYMYHCHILEHEEAGMMGTFQIQAPLP